MKVDSKILAAIVILTLSACSPGYNLKFNEIRRDVVASVPDFERAASDLLQGSIIWASHTNVRYKLDAGYRTESWGAAKISPEIKFEILNILVSHKINAIFVHEQRVNFVLWSAGIGPSGISLGVVVAPIERHGCVEVNSSLKMNGRGLQCERLADRVYLYSER